MGTRLMPDSPIVYVYVLWVAIRASFFQPEGVELFALSCRQVHYHENLQYSVHPGNVGCLKVAMKLSSIKVKPICLL